MPSFSFYTLAAYFILYAFLGWCLEVVFCSVNTGKFVNRGFLNGPLCPIYGFGAVIMIVALTPISHNLLVLFLGSAFLASLLELVTGFLLKKLFHTSWWDYSDQPFNIGGYVCLKFSLLWGLAGILLMRVLHPLIAGFVGLVPRWLGIPLLAVAYALLLADVIVTVNVVTKMNRDLGELDRVAKEIHKGSEATAEKLGGGAISLSKKVEEKAEEWDLEGKRQALEEKLEASRAALVERNERFRARLLKAFPNMKNITYPEALTEMREKLEQHSAQKKAAKRGNEKETEQQDEK